MMRNKFEFYKLEVALMLIYVLLITVGFLIF